MSLIRWSPFKEFDQYFDPSRSLLSEQKMKQLGSTWQPLVDVTEDANEYLIKAELPEVKKEDIKVVTSDGYLSISGERNFEKEDKKLHTMERFYGSFQRSFNLPENVAEEDISADFKDGLLTLHLTKTEKVKPSQNTIAIE
jgi:HSP20 family protein